MSASEIATSAWPSNSELRLEASGNCRPTDDCARLRASDGGLDSLHKTLGAPSDGVAIRLLPCGQRRPRNLPNWMSTTGRHERGSLIMFALRGRRTTGPVSARPTDSSATQVKETCDECA